MSTELRELVAVFLKLGATAFGGPAVHIALFEQEVVKRRKWLTHDEFLDLLGATNLIPGPNSTEMAIHVGLRRAGWKGLIVAGACFIFPAFLIVTACGWFYVRYAQLPQLEGILIAVKPVVLAIVLQALWRLLRTAVKTWWLGVMAAAAVALNLAGVHELLLLLAGGLLVLAIRQAAAIAAHRAQLRCIAAPLLTLTIASTSAASGVNMVKILLFFLKVGSVLYGSGYVLLAFLRADLVERWRWLTESQLLDAIAIGQVTPGPVFTTATFVGYLLAGFSGACVATLGIFLPAFVFVAISARILPRLRRSPSAAAFLDGVNIASLALMAAVSWHLGHSALFDATTVILFAASTAILLSTRLNPTWLIAASAALGLLAF